MSTEPSAVEDRVVPAGESANDGAAAIEQNRGAPETGATADPPVAGESGVKGPATPLEAVKAALVDKPAGDSPPPGDKPSQAAGTKEPAEKPTPEVQAATDKALPFANHPRWKEVYTAKQAAETAVAEMTPKAQRWDALDAKFRETGLTAEDVSPLFDGGAQLKRAGVTHEEIGNLMKVGAALKLGDRQVFQQIAGPVIEALGLQLVEKLPVEIQKMIDEGAITEDAGRTMAGLQHTARAEANRRTVAEGQVQTREQQEAASRLESSFEQASAAWESRVKPNDADWSRKEPFIVEAIKSRLALRRPTSPQEVEQICQDSYDQVTRIMKSGAPQRRPVTPAGGGSTTTVKAVPQTPLEATKLALGVS